MRTRKSVWAYPWDIADEGTDTVLTWLEDTGFDAIELCPNYHAISTFAPRNPGRSIFYSEQGGVFFPACAARYGRIVPQVFDEPTVVRAFQEVAEQSPTHGIQLNAWVIGMFQPWMARAYPDVAVENTLGARSYAQTCPSSPDVQEYLANLVNDLCNQYSMHSVTLEGIGHTAFAHGWVRERILVSLDPWTRYLAGLCFCENCLSAARTHGVDAEAVREAVAQELRIRISTKPRVCDLEAEIAARCETDEGFRGYLEAREQTATRTIDGVRRSLRGTDVGLNVTEASTGWSPSGLRLADLIDRIDGLLLPDPTDEAAEVKRQLQLARSPGRNIEIIISQWGSDVLEPFSTAFEARISRIAELGIDRVAIYNFGLLAPDTLRHIGILLNRHLPTQA